MKMKMFQGRCAARIAILEKSQITMFRTIVDLREQNARQQVTIDLLQKQNDSQQIMINDLQDKQDTIDELQRQNTSQQVTIGNLQDRLAMLQGGK